MTSSFDFELKAKEARRAQVAVGDAYKIEQGAVGKDHPAVQRWRAAGVAFHRAVAEAYPDGFWINLDLVRRGDGDGGDIDMLVDFIEADPMFFGSGYAKTLVLRVLKRTGLTGRQARRLRCAILAVVQRRWGREFDDYARLARRLDDPELRADLQALAAGEHPQAAIRARRVLRAVERA